jgi:PadR family transcriptional regulator, regulatory protein PadR
MKRNRLPSPEARALILTLAQAPTRWRHGYDLIKETGLKSGTLYPILMRLADRGLLEARWEEPEHPGRPPRHAYRLTAGGLAVAAELAAPAAGSGARLVERPA